MYRIIAHIQAQETIAELPGSALAGYAEALGVMKLVPCNGTSFRGDNPNGNIRTLPFGPGGLVVYLILEREQEVHVLEVQWVDISEVGT